MGGFRRPISGGRRGVMVVRSHDNAQNARADHVTCDRQFCFVIEMRPCVLQTVNTFGVTDFVMAKCCLTHLIINYAH